MTGGSRGIGLEIARHFIQEGAIVVISSRGQEQLTRAESELVSQFGQENVMEQTCDFTKVESVNDLAEYIEEQWSGVAIDGGRTAW